MQNNKLNDIIDFYLRKPGFWNRWKLLYMALVIVLAWQSTCHIGNITYSMILAFCFFFAALAGGVFVLNRPDLIQKLVFPDKELHTEPLSVRPDNLQENKSDPARPDFNQESTPEQHKPVQPSAPQYGSTPTTQSEPVRINNMVSSRTVEDIWQDINSMIGLESVKQALEDIQNNILANIIRQQQGMNISPGTLHMVFRGNPGTGKTEVARKVGELLCAIGALPGNAFLEVNQAELIAGYVGQTALKVAEQVETILHQGGGILFIDEAYGLTNAGKTSGGGDFGKDAVNVLIKVMDDYRDRLCVIMAGYPKEMNDFVYRSNPGLKSRIAFFVDFPDYSSDELIEILKLHSGRQGYKIEPAAIEKVRSHLPTVNMEIEGNGRYIRNLLENAVSKQARRVIEGANAKLLIADDFLSESGHTFSVKDIETIWEEINSMIGLVGVKKALNELQATVEANILKTKQGMNITANTLHMVFRGNPGTGKTEVARKVGELLCTIGALPGNAFLEINQADLIAGYIGQTALKTTDKVETVLHQGGGILFIDEAYGLTNAGKTSGGGDFGKDAVNVLIKAMDDYRDRLCVIMAGYPKEMDDFVTKSNPGLKSRIAFYIDFPDYSTDELIQILELHAGRIGYEIEPAAINKISSHLLTVDMKTEGNGRYIRNLLERAERQQNLRIYEAGKQGEEQVSLIHVLKAEDFMF